MSPSKIKAKNVIRITKSVYLVSKGQYMLITDPVTHQRMWDVIILCNKENKQDMFGDQSTLLSGYIC